MVQRLQEPEPLPPGVLAVKSTTSRRLAENLAYPARVTHPTFNGREIITYDVIIDHIQIRDNIISLASLNGPITYASGEEVRVGTQEIAFRGEARNGAWTGNKTFFATRCQRVVDGRTGEVMKTPERILSWLQMFIDEADAAEHREIERTTWVPLTADSGRDIIVRTKDHNFEVRVGPIERRGDGVIRFRGHSKRIPAPGQKKWSGQKTFYVDSSVDWGVKAVSDPVTGPVADMEAYLISLARGSTPR